VEAFLFLVVGGGGKKKKKDDPKTEIEELPEAKKKNQKGDQKGELRVTTGFRRS